MSSSTNNQRINFASIKNQLEYPDFLEVQVKSFQDFFQMDTPSDKRKSEGLYKVFTENFPIADTRNNFVLEFIDYYIDPPRYSIEECIERGLTYSVPLKAKLKLYAPILNMRILIPLFRMFFWANTLHDSQRYFCYQRS
jgi:DNA-directed RNA polymerase subunit beta